MSPRQWLATKWEKVVGTLTALLVLGCMLLLVWSVATGQDTNRVVSGQAEDRAITECRAGFAAADAVASANLDIAKAEGIDAFLAARATSTIDQEAFAASHDRLTTAIQERYEIAEIRGRVNELCSDPANLAEPPDVESLEPVNGD